jgi:glycosyltransferase involved in cell wall biosynthesis
MKVLQITQVADAGGAGICVRRLHEQLLARGHTARVLTGDATVGGNGIERMRGQSLLSRFCYHSLNLAGLNYLGILNRDAVLRHPAFLEADVVHLHNIHGGYFNYRMLPDLAALKPLVWTLHDMWALTGHCSHSFDCDRWRTGCGRCPYPRIYPPVRLDATRLDHALKRRTYARTALTLISPSRWLRGLVRESALSHLPVQHVPNGVDTGIYRPGDRDACRRALGIRPGRVVILATVPVPANPFKDRALLVAALRDLPHEIKAHAVLVTMGHDEPEAADLGGLSLHRLGYRSEDSDKATAYGAADVFVHPTRADNQPLALLEAMACGCPMVASDVGGVSEIVRTGETGYLARAGDVDDFSRGLMRVLRDDALRRKTSVTCREAALRWHDLSAHVEQVLAVYAQARETWSSTGG